METGVMPESVVVASDVHETVTEVHRQHVLDGFEQTDMTVAVVLDVLDPVREYTFISVEIQSV